MTSSDDPYRFSMEDSVFDTPRTRRSTRKRQGPSTSTEKNAKALVLNKRTENGSKSRQERVNTRSSQKPSASPVPDGPDHSFMSDVTPGFSQFVQSNKRPRAEKKTTATFKRPRGRSLHHAFRLLISRLPHPVTPHHDENEPPNDDVDNEIQTIEQVKLVYETAGTICLANVLHSIEEIVLGGRTNVARVGMRNAQILASRVPAPNTTYTIHGHNQMIDDTQTDMSAIPDTLVNNDTQQNDSSWQREIDRLMKKLEEPTCPVKSQTQIEETQVNDEEEEGEEVVRSTHLAQPPEENQQTKQVRESVDPHMNKNNSAQHRLKPITRTGEMSIQTDQSPRTSTHHDCCTDVSTCPCVLVSSIHRTR